LPSSVLFRGLVPGSRFIWRILMRCLPLLLVLCLIVQSVATAATPGQQAASTTPQQTQLTKVKAEVQKHGTGEKSRVKITLHDKSEQKGRITQIGEDSFSLADEKTGQVKSIAYADVESVRGPGLSKGAKIGIVVGVGLVVAIIIVVIVATHSNVGPKSSGI
jgi:hypothetical protein